MAESSNIRFVWYNSDGDNADIIGSINVQPDGSFTGQIDDPRVKAMLEANLLLDLGFSARANVPASVPGESGQTDHDTEHCPGQGG